MSFYTFAPAISSSHNHDFVTWDSAFNEEEIEKIKEYASKLILENATTVSSGGELENPDKEIRSSKVAWISNNEESNFIYERLAFVARQLNAKFYNFDLYGFLEDMQYTVYEESYEGHYNWHIDMSDAAPAARKLSLVVQLSDPSEYEGGELQVMNSSTVKSVEKKKGLVAAFPSWVLHKVSPVTKGTRHTLVIWVCGPSFK